MFTVRWLIAGVLMMGKGGTGGEGALKKVRVHQVPGFLTPSLPLPEDEVDVVWSHSTQRWYFPPSVKKGDIEGSSFPAPTVQNWMPRTLLPSLSRGGDQHMTPMTLGTTSSIPPDTPDFAGRPTCEVGRDVNGEVIHPGEWGHERGGVGEQTQAGGGTVAEGQARGTEAEVDR